MQFVLRPYALAVVFFALLGLAVLAGCEKHTSSAPPPPPPPAAVTVLRPIEREVIEWDIYTGHLEAPEEVNVVARISGMIMDMPLAEGAIVKKGDLLAVIDERPFKADLDAKLADLQKAEAQRSINVITYNRLKEVAKVNGVAQQDVDNAKAAIDQADAVVAGAKAAVESSRLNLEWCQVLSPINGRVSDKRITVGNFVNGGAGQATLLTTIQSVSPMYCYVDVDENSVLKYQKLAAEGKRTSARDGGRVPCYVQLANETGYPHEGIIDFVDNKIDRTTGTARARGILPNDKGQLLPGFFARMCVPGSGKYRALLVPDNAIGNDQDQRTLLVVGAENKVEPRRIQTGALFGNLRVITSGISPDDRIIINGQMHARPGSVVAPAETTIPVDEAVFSLPGAKVLSSAPLTTPATTQPDSAKPKEGSH